MFTIGDKILDKTSGLVGCITFLYDSIPETSNYIKVELQINSKGASFDDRLCLNEIKFLTDEEYYNILNSSEYNKKIK